MGASVVSRVDASPVLEACEEVLDFVALAIQDGVVAVPGLVLGVRRNACGDAAPGQCLTEPD